MLAIPKRRASLVGLLLLLILGCAWASEGPKQSNESDLESASLKISNTQEAVWSQIVVTNINDAVVASESTVTGTTQYGVDDGGEEDDDDHQAQGSNPSSRPPHGATAAAAAAEDDLQLRRRKRPTSAEAAQITPPPRLFLLHPRQDQAQVDQLNARIQSLQQSAQQALQALSDASRVVSQASQQLSQSSQQLSQDSSRLSGSSQSLSLALSLATQSEASLSGALSAAISSGSSAFASCTNSASSLLALASGDAVTKVGAALAQATVARTEADREVSRAQSSAVSITQAAAIIVGASAGSSLITIIIILLVLRYRRNKRREREARAEAEGGGSMYNAPRPGTSGSYNSMASGGGAAAARDMKQQPIPPPEMTGSTAVAGAAPLERFQSVRIVDVSRNGSKNSSNSNSNSSSGVAEAVGPSGGGRGAGQRSKPESFLGERLSKLGITRRPTGEALTTNNVVQRATAGAGATMVTAGGGGGGGGGAARKPVMTLADPPAPGAKREKEIAASSKTTPTFSVFPKVDPDPKGTHMLKTVREEDQRRPPSSGAALQAWLQTADVSPFGPLDPPAKASTAGVRMDNNGKKDDTSKRMKRLSDVKWPLQETSKGTGLGRSATDASSRYSQNTVVDGGEKPVVTMRENLAAAGSPRVVPGGRGPGLPGSVRKVTAGSVRDVSALGRDQRLGG